VLDDGARFSTDALGTLPLWKLSRPGFTAISPEAKAFAAIEGVTLKLKPIEALLAPGERPIDWSPYDPRDPYRPLCGDLLSRRRLKQIP